MLDFDEENDVHDDQIGEEDDKGGENEFAGEEIAFWNFSFQRNGIVAE